MRSYLIICLTFLFISAIINSAHGQWEKMFWDNTGLRKIVAVTDSTIFAIETTNSMTYDSILVSHNNGESWTKRIFFEKKSIDDHRWINNNGFFYVSGLNSDSLPTIFISTDKGDSWNIYTTFHPLTFSLISSFSVSLDTCILLLSEPNASPSLSIDHGKSWVIAKFSATGPVAFNNGIFAVYDPDKLDLRYSFDFINWVDHFPGRDMGGSIIDGQLFSAEGNGQHIYGLKMLSDTGWVHCNGGLNRSKFTLPCCKVNGIFYATSFDPASPPNSSDTTALYFSSDGCNWEQLGSTVINSPNVFIGSQYIFLSGVNQLWRTQLSRSENGALSTSRSETLSLSPNPTTALLTIHNAPENLCGISIVNVLGQVVMETEEQHSSEFTIDLSPLPAGMYYARISAGSLVEVRKIVKE